MLKVEPLVESLREGNQREIQLIDSLSALTALVGLPIDGRDEAALVRGMLRILLENQPIERCSVFLAGERGLVNAGGVDWHDIIHEQISGAAESIGASSLGEGAVFQSGEGLVGEAARTGQLQHARNCAEDPRFKAKPEARVNNASGSLICVPVHALGTTLGVLSLYHSRPDQFSLPLERFSHLFASFMGQILISARHVQRLEDAIQQRTQQLEQALHRTAELKDQFEQLSTIDELTQLHNRRFFFPQAEAALSRAVRYGRDFALVILDLDHFKYINDRCGHAFGDRILQDIARILEQQTRVGDVLARLGGEEFVIALPETGIDGVRILTERMLAAIRTHVLEADGAPLHVSASAGIGVLGTLRLEPRETLLDRLLNCADQALYASKDAGRDCYRIFGIDAISPDSAPLQS